MHHTKRVLILTVLIVPAVVFCSLPSAFAGKLQVDADRIEYETKAGVFKASGSVRITEAGYKITGTEARFYSKEKEKRALITGNPVLESADGTTMSAARMELGLNTRVFTATGGVRINRKDIKAGSETAVYRVGVGELQLKGSASAEQGGSSIRADRMTLTEKTIKAEGRAHLEIALEGQGVNG